jgi:hypothetical protein
MFHGFMESRWRYWHKVSFTFCSFHMHHLALTWLMFHVFKESRWWYWPKVSFTFWSFHMHHLTLMFHVFMESRWWYWLKGWEQCLGGALHFHIRNEHRKQPTSDIGHWAK